MSSRSSSHKDYKLSQIHTHGVSFLNSTTTSGMIYGFQDSLMNFFFEEKISKVRAAGQEVKRLSDTKVTLDDLKQQIIGVDLFGSSDVFAISSLDSYKNKKQIVEWYNQEQPSNLILKCVLKSVNKLFETLSKSPQSIFCPKSFAVDTWVGFVLKYYALNMSSDGVQKIIEASGEDTLKSVQIARDLKLLSDAYGSGSKEKWEVYLSEKHGGKLFDIESLLFHEKWSELLDLLEHLLASGVSELVVLSVFARHFRKMISLKGGSNQDIRFLPPSVQRQHENFAKKYSADVFAKGLVICQNIDNKFKKSKRDGIVCFIELLSIYRRHGAGDTSRV